MLQSGIKLMPRINQAATAFLGMLHLAPKHAVTKPVASLRTKKLTPEMLEPVVKSLLEMMRANYPLYYDEYQRCHEFARLLTHGFEKRGFKAVLRDGHAVYEADFLRNENSKSPNAPFNRDMTFKRISYLHSWCEVGGIRIDFHTKLRTYIENGRISGIKDFLLVKKFGELDGLVRYIPCGREFGFWKLRFIYFRNSSPSFVRLQMGKMPQSLWDIFGV